MLEEKELKEMQRSRNAEYVRFIDRFHIHTVLKGLLAFALNCNSNKINLRVDSKGESHTDGKNITVSLVPFFYEPKYGPEEWGVVMKMLAFHEAQHINSSRISAMKEIRLWYGDYLSTNYGINKRIGQRIGGDILNIVEDGRIELINVKRMPGNLFGFRFLNAVIRDYQKISGPGHGERAEFEDFWGNFLSYCKTGLCARGIRAYRKTRFEKEFMAVRDLADRGIEADTADDCVALVKEILISLAPYFADLMRMDSALRDFLEKLAQIISNEWSTDEETQTNGNSDSGDGQVITVRIKRKAKPGEKSEDNKKVKGKKSKSDEEPDGANDAQGDSQPPVDSGEEEKERSTGSMGEPDTDSDDDEPAAGSSEDGGGVAKEEEDTSPPDGDAGTSGGEDETGSADETGGGSQNSTDKGADEEGEDGSDKSGTGTEEDNGGGEGEDDGECENSSQTSSGDQKSGDSFKGTDSFDQEKDMEPGCSEEELEELKRLFETDVENAQAAERNQERNAPGLSKQEKAKIQEIYVKEHVRAFRETFPEFPALELPAELMAEAKALRRVFERVLKNKKVQRKGLKKGVFDAASLWKVGVDSPYVFQRKGQPVVADCVVFNLIDNSGSMNSSADVGGIKTKSTCARTVSAVIEEAIRGLLPCKISLFDVNGFIDHLTIKDFKDHAKVNRSWSSLPRVGPGGGNKDGYSIRIAATELLKQPQHKKILLLLSDGLPSDYNGGSDAGMKDVKAAVKEARRKGIVVIPIMFGNNGFSERYANDFQFMYERDIISCSASNIMGEFKKLFEKFIKNS